MSLNINLIGPSSPSFSHQLTSNSSAAGSAPPCIISQPESTKPPPLDERVKKTNPFPLYPAIISILFQFAVSKKTEIVRFASVCHLFNVSMKEYHHVARFIERAPVSTLNLTPEQLMDVLKQVGKGIKTLDLNGLTIGYALLEPIVTYCPNLEKLGLTICPIVPANLPIAASSMLIESSEETAPLIEFSYLRRLPHLREIDLTHEDPSSTDDLDQHFLRLATAVGDKIHSIHLQSFHFSSEINQFLNQLIPYIPNLRVLDINGYAVSTIQLANLTQLTELNLRWNKAKQIDSLIVACFKNMPELIRLNLTHSSYLSSEAFAHLPKESKLQGLNVHSCHHLGIHFFSYLEGFKSLQELDIRRLTMTQRRLESLTHHCSHLSQLNLEIERKIYHDDTGPDPLDVEDFLDLQAPDICVSAEVIDQFLSQLTHLKALNFSHRLGISNGNLQSLNNATQLQKLVLDERQMFGWGEQLTTRNFSGNWQELQEIILISFDIDETNVRFFKQLPKLNYLDLSMSRLTEGAFQLLKTFDLQIEIRISTETKIFSIEDRCFSLHQINDFYRNGRKGINEGNLQTRPYSIY